MILYHGSKKIFDRFQHEFVETGEGAGQNIFGFWFVNSIRGAGNHADLKLKHIEGEPCVYICEIPDHLPTLTLGIPVKEQKFYSHWKNELPVSISAHDQEEDWFYQMFSSSVYKGKTYSKKDKLKTLYEAGFIAVHNFELQYTDGYLHGETSIIMDVDQINIIDIIHTHSEQYLSMRKSVIESSSK